MLATSDVGSSVGTLGIILCNALLLLNVDILGAVLRGVIRLVG